MTSISFHELVNLVPRGDDLRDKAAATLPTGVSHVQASNPCFVEPDLQVQQPIELGSTSAVLLYAPGAVGKSTLAAELAWRCGAFLWDLSKFQVGSRTFSGTILDLYGFVSTGVQKRLQEGQLLFVLDALDEAQVRAGSQNFDAFVSDLAVALREPRARPCVVLLARSDTADWIHLLFDDANVPLARYQIDQFDKPRAVSFIEKRLDDRRSRDGSQALHRQQAKPFAEALSVLLGLVYRLFGVSEADAWADRRVRNFLGYAPVLEALTDYVDVGNYMALIRELQEEAGAARDPWRFLADIINRLLQREQSKVQVAVRSRLDAAAKEAQWSEWQRLYTPEEQCARVLGQAVHVPVDPLGGSVPLELARRYEESVTTILPQHPFLSGRHLFANVVFKEFVYAWGVTRGPDVLQESLRTTMQAREDPFLPSQLFSRFVLNLGGEGAVVVDGQDFAVLYESVLSRAHDAELTLVQAGEGIHASILVDREEDSELEIEVLDTGGGVHFWRRLCNADLEVPGGVRLGLPGQRFLLGPAVHLNCGQLALGCQDLDVDVTDTVRIHAGSYIPGPENLSLRVRNESRGNLAVFWPGVGHPWVLYKVSETKGPLGLSETIRGDTLRKFVMMFRRQRTRLERTLLNARWSADQLNDRTELLALAARKGVLWKVPGHETLEFNSDYDSLRTLVDDRPALAPNAREFVAEYLGSEQAERLLKKLGA